MLQPLYEAVVAAGRDPAWYRNGQVPDTIDGRFDMIAALLSLVLLRLEAEGADGRRAGVRLTEAFIADMDGSVRQLGAGDLVVGKHVGKMVGALGGRLAAFRDAAEGRLEAPVTRNVFRGAPPSPEAAGFVAARLERFRDALASIPAEALLAGEIPRP
ncbi:MAG TPA: ubiquinol-cytochrome C chaperone family protein [Allosphingosinicella sp.]|nr:ubiquinol-cytochrome C chaperone family protein [Allosphingosinicella sp.]